MNSETPKISINGMAHVILTVSQFDKARTFYSTLLPQFGMTCVNDGPDFLYHVGARTAIGVRRCDPEFEGEQFQQYRIGLHHLCLRGRSREDVDKTAVLVAKLGTKSYADRKNVIGQQATIMSCSKTLMASALKSTSYPAQAY